MKSLLRAALMVVLISSCNLATFNQGSIHLSISEVSTKSLAPALSLDPDSYSITGSGPQGETLSLVTGNTEIIQDNLSQGTWDITVEAYNATAQLIGSGSNSVEVVGNQTSPCPITVVPIQGQGTLNLSLDWPSTDVISPVINAKVVTLTGVEHPLPFNITGPGTADCSYNLDNGHYQLFLELQDSTNVVMGLTESVYIVNGYITDGQYVFTDVNELTGTIDIDVLIDLIIPVDVVMTGQVDTMNFGSSITLDASAPGEVVPINYSWYVNGSLAGTGSTFDFGAGMNPGVYRLDVIGVTADQTRAGSTSHTVEILE